MKKFTRIEPTTIQEVGDRFKDQIVVKRYQTEDGLTHEFTTFHKEGMLAVATLALTEDNRAIIVRQFRAGRESYCDDIPGGAVEAGEGIEAAAKRELMEETGYQPGAMRYLGAYSWDAYANLTAHYFLALDCKLSGEPNRDQTETDQGIETRLISIAELIENAKTNKMTDAVAVLMAYDTLKELEGGER